MRSGEGRTARSVARLVVLAGACLSLFAGFAGSAAADPVVYAAGDIACDPADASFNGGLGTATACRQMHTSDLMVGSAFDTVLALGDLQYNSATLTNFQQSYDPSWGRVKAQTRPVIGNHEGTTATGGAGYCSYFGAAAHCNASNRQGGAAFYSFDVGTWHVVVLNSNCDAAGGCDVGSAQYDWLAADLNANPRTCTIAAWHHPRWSSGHDGDNAFMQPIWKLFYDHGGDLVLAGHSHDYERFAPIDGDGAVSPSGMRSFVVGTGGVNFTGIGGTPSAGSEARQNDTFGILKLDLHPAGYDWTFLPEAGRLFTDSGSQDCRTASGDTQAPSAPAGLTASGASSSQVDLSWTASTDDVGVSGYEIWRGPQGGTLTRIDTTTGTGTTYADTTVAAGQAYSYQVRARDAAGNRSGPSNTASVTTPGGAAPLTFRADADASARLEFPTTNFGTATTLTSDSDTQAAETYLRFNVAGVGGRPVTSATLRLFVPSNTAVDGPGVYACTDPACATWTETGITWNNRPARAATPVADVGAIGAGVWVEWDVTPLISGDGAHTLVVGQTGTPDGTAFSSDEAATNRPELVVTVGDGTTASDTQAPSDPTGLTATAASSSRVDLSWTGSTDNVGVTGYEIWRGPQGGTLTRIATTTGTGTTFADSTAAPGQAYSYEVRATDAAGNVSGPSNTASATTPAAPDTQAPSAPTGLGATAASSARVDLAWTGSTDDVGVTGYEVWRGPQGGTLARIATTTGTGTTFADTTVAAGQGYDYQVRAVDAAGNTSPPSNTASATTPPSGGGGGGSTTLAPFRAVDDAAVRLAAATSNLGTSTNLNADGGSDARESYLRFTVSGVAGRTVTSAKLRLFVSTDGTVDGPGVFRCAALACGTWTEGSITWSNRPARDVTPISDVGPITAPNWVEWDVTPLVTGDGTFVIVVGQTPTTDGVVFRSDESTTSRPELVLTVGGGSTPPPSDTQAPSAPTGLGATAASSSRVDLAWTGSTDDVGVTGYEVWRGPQGGTLARIATTTGTGTTFADTAVAAGQGYDYQVRAVDAAGNTSPPSNTASATTPPSGGGGGGGGTALAPFRAVDDAAVRLAMPTSNLGTSTNLNADGGADARESYLRFTVSGVAGRTVTSAKLRLFVNSDGTADGPGVFRCVALACDTWTEGSITWSNRPARDVTPISDVGPITAPKWVEWDVTPLVTGDGTFVIVVGATPTSDGVVFRSDEASTSKPELVVSVA